MFLSKNQIYNKFKEWDDECTCPVCHIVPQNPFDRSFVLDMGVCPKCDHIASDVAHTASEEEDDI